MASSIFVLVFVAFLVLVSNFGEGSAMKMRIQTNEYDGVIATSANISCVPDAPEATDRCAIQVLAIQLITKYNGKPLVTVQKGSKMSYNPLWKANIQATGNVSASNKLEENNLNVVLSDLTQEDNGQYSCLMLYLDEGGNLKQDVATKILTIEHHDTGDVIRYLMGKLTSMEKLVETQQAQLVALENRTKNPQVQESSPLVGFSAGYSNNNIYEGETLVFTKELLDVNNDYNPDTGVFTAPMDGLYVFHLVISTDTNKGTILVDLMVDDGKAATLMIYDDEYRVQSSVSALVSLETGNKVRPVINKVTGSYSNNNVHAWDHYSLFTGYLLKKL